MKAFSGLLRSGLSAGAVLAIVSGCGGSQTQTNALVPGQSNAATAELGRLGVGSSMAADAQSSDLLYVADAKDGSVHVYSYPAGKPQGRLLDVRANALCAGKNGDVFAPAGNEVLRYAHGGTRPIAALHDPLGTAPQFCAVDSATGNLAVSGGSATQSGVAIYAAAKGSPTIYAERNGARYGSVAYDNAGNLFALTPAGKVVELANGGKRFRELDWSGARPTHAGAIQWDGKYLAVASDAAISRYTVTGYQATPAGEIVLKGYHERSAVLDSRRQGHRPRRSRRRALRLPRGRERPQRHQGRPRRASRNGQSRRAIRVRDHHLPLRQPSNRMEQ